MELTLRYERPEEFREVEELTREAFWNRYKPGCDEHYLLHVMRSHPDYLPNLSCVAVENGRIVGHIAYSRARIVPEQGEAVEVICFGPISVLPEKQGQGVGSSLIRHTLALAKEAGERAVVIYGDPAYYERFGFVGGERFGISTPDGKYIPALMALELYPGALDGLSGRCYESPVFAQSAEDTEAFDASFPPKVKLVTSTQL